MTEAERDFMCEALIRRARSLSADVKSMNEEIAKILARLDELVPLGWELVVDGIPAKKKLGNRSFSPELALARLTPDEQMLCRADGFDNKKIREMAEAKGLVESCMVQPDADKASVKLKP
jgi:hypothetical protein